MNSELTILIPTHTLRSAPSVKVIKQTISSLESFLELQKYRVLIGIDTWTSSADITQEYIENINNLQIGTSVFPPEGEAGQRANFLNLIKQVTTPYFLFIEHDWVFVENPPMDKIIKVMDKYDFINTIYFNKRPNLPLPYPVGDFILKPEPRVTEIPLLKTSKWSNNPNITRTSKWKEWMPIVENAPLNRNYRRKQVEPPIHHLYIKQIQQLGFDEAHSLWGMYSYGKLSQNKMVRHLDGGTVK